MRRLALAVLLVAASCSTENPYAQKKPVARDAGGVPKPPPPKSMAELRERAHADLVHGRELEKQEKWAEAIPVFDAVKGAIPDEQHALAELGQCYYHLKDYGNASTYLARAVDKATEMPVRASAAYTLGRIEEEAGQKDAAIASYKVACGISANELVRRRLTALDPTTQKSQAVASEQGPGTMIIDQAYKTLHDVPWKTLTYNSLIGTATLVDGRWEDPATGSWFELADVAYGNFTGDKSEQAVVVTREGEGGTLTYTFVQVYGLESGGVTWMGDINPRIAFGWGSVAMKKGELAATWNVYAATDADCCPSQTTVVTWKWNGKDLIGPDGKPAVPPPPPPPPKVDLTK